MLLLQKDSVREVLCAAGKPSSEKNAHRGISVAPWVSTMAYHGAIGMDQRARRSATIFLLVALAAMILLSPALGDLQLGAGNPFPGASGASFENEPATTTPRLSAVESLPAFRGVLAVSLVVLGALLVSRLAALANPRRLLGIAAAIAVIVLLMISLPRIPSGGAVALPPESAAPRVPAAEVVLHQWTCGWIEVPITHE